MANEKRLIDANALLGEDGLFDKRGCCGNCQHCSLWSKDGCRVILDAPTVEAVEVVHGRWIDKTEWIGSFGQIKTECSVCGTIYPHKPGSRGDGKGGKFCEECGARMDGAE